MHPPRLLLNWFVGLLMSVSAILPASARQKSDVVWLKNGDRITCEVKYLRRGMLTVSTDSMSTVQIKWQDVESVTSDFLFTVQDTEGQLYVGSLAAAADAHHVNIAGPVPASNMEHLSVVEIRELEDSVWKRFSGIADLGYSFTKASDRTQFNFSGDLAYRTERYSGELNYSSTVGTSEGSEDANREKVSLGGSLYLARKWLAYTQVVYDHNLELQLDRRVTFLGGPGYRVAQSNKSLVTVMAGAAFTRESYYGEDSVKNAEGVFGIDAQFFKLYSPKFDITNRFVFFPNFTTWGRRRIEYSAQVRLELLKDFFVTLTFYDSYDSKPPSSRATGNDYGFTTGLSWSFRK